MNIYTTLFFITISTFTGSLRQILNKKYILQNIASGEYKLLNYFLKFIVSLIFFFFVKKINIDNNFINNIYSTNYSQKGYNLHIQEWSIFIINIILSTISSIIYNEIKKTTNNFPLITTFTSTSFIIFTYLLNKILLDGTIKSKTMCIILWISMGLFALYNDN